MTNAVYHLKKKAYYILNDLFPSAFKRKSFHYLHAALTEPAHVGELPEIDLLALKYILGPGSVAIDIGANNGLYCYFFEEIARCKTVLAFEPLPHLYKKLAKWFPGIGVSPLAMSDAAGQAKIRIPYINHKLYETRAKLDSLKEADETDYKEIGISTDTLDHVLASKNLQRIDLIKIDIEGHELKAINGAGATIAKYSPFLLVEIEKRHHADFSTVFDRMRALNYGCVFFNFKTRQLESFSQYDPERMQDPKNQNTFNYINNFLFVPALRSGEVEKINQHLKSYFNPHV